ncbi:MAG TPA: hypothetical protein VG318_15245 [Actinomycetota bacterium]|nr:hypothetical protein [Actinomycetota bacterium]
MGDTFVGGQSTNTTLTPNSNATCTPLGDDNNDTNISFMYNNQQAYWNPSVSSGSTAPVKLGVNRGNGVVTFVKGLTVEYIPLDSGHYMVNASGTILDSGSEYDINTSLGTYPIAKPSGG